MYTSIKFLNVEKTMIAALTEVGVIEILEPSHGGTWLSAASVATDYAVPPINRAAMTCTPAQIRLALLDMGLLDAVQALADSNPSAAIVWEYATTIYRMSSLIDSLKSEAFTDAQIDDIFFYAKSLLS